MSVLHNITTIYHSLWSRGLAAVVLVLAMLGGCAVYHPVPLTSEGIENELKPPDMKTVRIAASSINHPLLKPVPFDDRDGLSPDEAHRSCLPTCE